jgi:hypothetical protein
MVCGRAHLRSAAVRPALTGYRAVAIDTPPLLCVETAEAFLTACGRQSGRLARWPVEESRQVFGPGGTQKPVYRSQRSDGSADTAAPRSAGGACLARRRGPSAVARPPCLCTAARRRHRPGCTVLPDVTPPARGKAVGGGAATPRPGPEGRSPRVVWSRWRCSDARRYRPRRRWAGGEPDRGYRCRVGRMAAVHHKQGGGAVMVPAAADLSPDRAARRRAATAVRRGPTAPTAGPRPVSGSPGPGRCSTTTGSRESSVGPI